MTEEHKEHWTVDKRVPLALILTLAMQTAGAIWWASSVSGRVDQLEQAVVIHDQIISRMDDRGSRAFEIYAARLDARLTGMERDIARVGSNVEKLVEALEVGAQ